LGPTIILQLRQAPVSGGLQPLFIGASRGALGLFSANG
jgi:hypothetical protein